MAAVHLRAPAVLLALSCAWCCGPGGSGGGTASASASAGGTGPASPEAVAALEQALATGGTVTLAGAEVFEVRSLQVLQPGTTLVCTGSPTPATLRLPVLGASDGSPVLLVRADHFTIRSCILDGNRGAQPPGGFRDSYQGRAFRAGIRMDGGQGLSVEGVTFRNVFGAAIATRDVADVSVRDSTFQDDNFEAVFADSSVMLGDPRQTVAGFTFVGNTVTGTGSGDGRVNANGLLVHQVSGLRIEDNTISGYERSGIKLENCRDGTITGNRLRQGSMPNFAAITMQNGAHRLSIQDNDIQEVGSGIDTSLVSGGQYPPDEVVDVTMRANTIRAVHPGITADGIRVLGYGDAITDVTIADNVVEDVPRSGITLRTFRTFHPSPAFTRISIRGNQLHRAGSCGDFFSGSPVPPTSVSVSGNRCD